RDGGGQGASCGESNQADCLVEGHRNLHRVFIIRRLRLDKRMRVAQYVVMRHVANRIIIGAALFLACGFAQTGAPEQQFEAATIKLHPNCTGAGMPPPGRLSMRCVRLRDAVTAAFSEGPTPQRLQVLGGPSWIDSDTYDIEATPADGNVSLLEIYGPMLQKLLKDRLQLRIHKESREQPVYALTVAKNGPKLTPSKEGSCVSFDLDHPLPTPQPGQPLPSICGRIPTQRSGAKTIVNA